MKRTTKIAGIAAALVLPAGALAGGIAQAQSSHAPAHHARAQQKSAPAGETTGTDTDNVQEGDQTGPDGVDGSAAVQPSRAVVKPAHAAARQAPVVRAQSGGSQTGSQRGTQGGSQTSDDEGTGEEEGGASDGPGGHEDPAGDVQHEGGAGEQ